MSSEFLSCFYARLNRWAEKSVCASINIELGYRAYRRLLLDTKAKRFSKASKDAA